MCCKTVIQPLIPEIAQSVLLIGQFEPHPSRENAWQRHVIAEGTTVTAAFGHDGLELSLSPSVSQWSHHAQKRLAAGIYFEIATRYAEKVGGVIEQHATVVGCKDVDGTDRRILASYPSIPMSFDNVCAGFQEAILGEVLGDGTEVQEV